MPWARKRADSASNPASARPWLWASASGGTTYMPARSTTASGSRSVVAWKTPSTAKSVPGRKAPSRHQRPLSKRVTPCALAGAVAAASAMPTARRLARKARAPRGAAAVGGVLGRRRRIMSAISWM
jgi:hypothetical protein